VPIRSAEALNESLQQLADDPTLRPTMSEAALKCVRSMGEWGKTPMLNTATSSKNRSLRKRP
jgi:hypothetical protein